MKENHEKAIVKYLLDNGLKMEFPYHAGTFYQAAMNDSTFIIKYHSMDSNWSEYDKLKSELNK